MDIEVVPVFLSFDADKTNPEEVLEALSALIGYSVERGGYPELASVELELGGVTS